MGLMTYRSAHDRSSLSALSVWIAPRVWSTDHDGAVRLSASCITESEVDFEIDEMIASLERVRRQAKHAMRRYRARQLTRRGA
jgi:hypothetical protein